MDDDNTPRFSPEDRIPDVPANDPIPPGELMDARYFLSGWTLKRYTSRFRRESKEEGETECADDEGDGVTPVGPGAFGWTPEGPPGRRAGRRRPHGVLTIPTRATVGQVRYTLGFLSFPRFFRPDPTAPSPGSARPRRRERARGARGGRSHGRIRRLDQRRVVAPADTAGDVPGALGPGVCISGRVKCTHSCVFLSCLSWTWFRCDVLYHRPVCHVSRQLRPNAGKQGDARRNKNTQHFTLRLLWSTRPYPPEDIEAGADELVPSSPAPRTRRDALDAFAATNATNTWLKLSRPGDDGDTCYLGFADTTLLDFVSRGLDARELEDKRVGDFDPSHRIAVFTEPESESSSKTNGHGDSSDEDGRLVRSGHATSVGQRGFAAGRARPDGSGPGSTRYFSENRDDGVAGVDARGLLGGGGDVRLFRRRVFRVDAQLKGERGGGAGQTRPVHDRVDIGVGCETSDVRERPGGRVDVDRR